MGIETTVCHKMNTLEEKSKDGGPKAAWHTRPRCPRAACRTREAAEAAEVLAVQAAQAGAGMVQVMAAVAAHRPTSRSLVSCCCPRQRWSHSRTAASRRHCPPQLLMQALHAYNCITQVTGPVHTSSHCHTG